MRVHSVLFLTLSAWVIGCGDKGSDTGEPEPVDADGDGSFELDDCDDSDASIYPGAEDVWYDGVDSNCDNADDYDADTDGVRSDEHGGADCDDTDASISPLADEVWYDGIDSDCNGLNDYDADLDGFDAVDKSKTGMDCDDSDASVYPNASGDVWYDGIDTDCDGLSDYDADYDGHDSDEYGGDDCDDSDENAYEGAVETWYDGVDSDCAGDDDFDADADGYLSDAYGGTDCADDDPEAYSGASEQIDGIDTDCDGTSDRFSIDDAYGGSYILGEDADGMLGWGVSVGTLDKDGYADIAMMQPTDTLYSPNGAGAVHIFSGSNVLSPTAVSMADYRVLSANAIEFSQVSWLSDLDGDGMDELSISVPTASGLAPMGGQVYLFSSMTLSAATDDLSVEAADWSLSGTSPGTFLGSQVSTWTDRDGTGAVELVGSSADVGGGRIWLWSTDTTGVMAVNDATFSVEEEVIGSGMGTDMVEVGDLDGDGYSELAVSAPYQDAGVVYLLKAPTDDSVEVWATLLGGSTGDDAGVSLSAGDLDGDGISDLVIGAMSEETQAGRVHVVAGSAINSGIYEIEGLETVSYGGATVYGNAGTSVASGHDVNGDGLDDIVVGGPGDANSIDDGGSTWLVISGRTGERALADADGTFVGVSDQDWAGSSVDMGDINGDGLSDLIFGVPGEDSTFGNEGAVYIGLSGY